MTGERQARLGARVAASVGEEVCAAVYAGGGAALADPRAQAACCTRLRAHGVLSLAPQACRQALREETARMLLLRDDLLHTVRTLSAAQVPLLTLKGPVLGLLAWGSATARASTDIDLLVREADHRRALAALRGAGYQHLASDYSAGQIECFTCPAHANTVELHFQFSSAERFGALHRRMWDAPASVELGGVELPHPSLDLYLPYLLAHLARHVGSLKLMWFEDLRQLAARHAVDWDAVLARIREHRLANAAAIAVTLIEALFARYQVASPFPAAFVAGLARAQARSWQALYRYLLPRLIDARAPANLRRLHSFGLSENWKDRIDLAWSFARRRLGS